MKKKIIELFHNCRKKIEISRHLLVNTRTRLFLKYLIYQKYFMYFKTHVTYLAPSFASPLYQL